MRADAGRGRSLAAGPRRLRALLAAAALLGLVAVGTVILATRSGAPPPHAAGARGTPASWRKSLVPAQGDLLGAWVRPDRGFSPRAQEDAVIRLEQALGRKLAIQQVYARWGVPLPLAVARWDLRAGRIPMISWGQASTNLIAAGAYDAQIRARALQLRDLHGPVLLRWFWEMDGVANRPNAVSPASYIRAWRHIHNIFASVGAHNVRWIWCPNAFAFSSGLAQRFYPGNAYVDWIGADGYNWYPKRHGDRWRSFGAIFSAFYRWGLRTGKPMLVGEFGVLEAAPGRKAGWFTQAERELRTQFREIRAVVYFDSGDQTYNWRVTTSPSALAAFRSLATAPYFSARPST